MPKLTLSTRIYLGLIVVLAALAAINVFLPQGEFVPAEAQRELPASKPVLALAGALSALVLYGAAGLVGLHFTRKLGLPDVWDNRVSNRQRFVVPAISGAIAGVFLILGDTLFSRFHPMGPLPHPPFPTSLVASLAAAIGEETIFRLFFTPFWTWVIFHFVLKDRWKKQVFWVMAIISALAFALGHLPSVMVIMGAETAFGLPPALFTEIIVLNGAVALLAAHQLRNYGFLAAAGVHFWADIVWHVLYGPAGR